jgi:hypothetical protein
VKKIEVFHSKGKVNFILEQTLKVQRGSRGIALLFFNLDSRGGSVVNAMPRLLYPRERPGTHCTGGRVGPRAGLDGWFTLHTILDLVYSDQIKDDM